MRRPRRTSRKKRRKSRAAGRWWGTGSSGWARRTGSCGRAPVPRWSSRRWSAFGPCRSRSGTPPGPCTAAGRVRHRRVASAPTSLGPWRSSWRSCRCCCCCCCPRRRCCCCCCCSLHCCCCYCAWSGGPSSPHPDPEWFFCLMRGWENEMRGWGTQYGTSKICIFKSQFTHGWGFKVPCSTRARYDP